MTNTEKFRLTLRRNVQRDDLVIASNKLKAVGLSNVITITDQNDKDKLANDTLLKAMLFGGNSYEHK
jgi:hypothetical protein